MVQHPRGHSRVWLWSVMAVMITRIRDWQGLHYNTNVRLGSEELDWQKTNSGYCDWETQRVCQRDIWFSRIWLWSGEGSHNYRAQGLTQWQGSQVWDLAQKSLTAPNQAVVTVTKRLKRVCVIFGSAEFGCEVWWQSWLQGSGTSDKVCVRDWDLAHQNLAVKGE